MPKQPKATIDWMQPRRRPSSAFDDICKNGFTYSDGRHVQCLGNAIPPVNPDSLVCGYYFLEQGRWVAYLISPTEQIRYETCQDKYIAISYILTWAKQFIPK